MLWSHNTRSIKRVVVELMARCYSPSVFKHLKLLWLLLFCLIKICDLSTDSISGLSQHACALCCVCLHPGFLMQNGWIGDSEMPRVDVLCSLCAGRIPVPETVSVSCVGRTEPQLKMFKKLQLRWPRATYLNHISSREAGTCSGLLIFGLSGLLCGF